MIAVVLAANHVDNIHVIISAHQHLRKDYAARTTSSEGDSTEVEGEEEIDMLTNWDVSFTF